MSTTPLDREILSHYYCGPSPFPRANTPAVIVATESFVNLGLLHKLAPPNEYGAEYAANHEALDVYMRALDAVPLPIKITEWRCV